MDNLVGSKQLPPGFRFHPTDEELCMYYLKRKVLGKSLGFELISELDVYKFSPWDLPSMVCYKSSDLDCYFYCPRGKKYPSGRTNRATECGYWKATGKDRPVEYKNRCVGKIKTLVFHVGKAPKGERTDWVMHEYRLEDGMLADMGVAQDGYVISKVFKKSGIGPKNWEQRVAPFVEEEWDCFDDSASVNGAVLNARLVSEPAVTVDYENLTVAGSNAGLVSQPAETGTSALYSGSLLTGTGSVYYENMTAAGSTMSNAGLVSQPVVTGTVNAVYSGSLFTDEHFVQSVGNVNPGLVSQPAVTGTSALYSANLFTDQHPVHSVFNTNAGLVSKPEDTQPPVNTNPVGDPQAFSFGIEGEEDEIDRLFNLMGEGDFEGLDDQLMGDDIFSGLGDLDNGFLELNDFEEP